MRIIGLNIGHDVCLTVVEDGRCLYFEDLSRTFRQKLLAFDLDKDVQHDSRLVSYCRAKAAAAAADHWAITLNPLSEENLRRSLLLVESLVGSPPNRQPADLLYDLLSIGHTEFNSRCTLVEHGIAHIASGWFTSGFEAPSRTLGIALDGWSTKSPDTIGVFSDDILKASWRRHVFPICGSFFDTYLSALLFGRPALDSAGKLMGYAAWGSFDNEIASYLYETILPQVDPRPEREVMALEDDSFNAARQTLRRLPQLREEGDVTINPKVQNFFSTAQEVFSTLVVNTILSLVEEYQPTHLIWAGGCALSITTNSRLRRELSGRVQLYIPPFANDLGQAYGAARFVSAISGATHGPDFGSFYPFLGKCHPLKRSRFDVSGYKEIDYDPTFLAMRLHEGAVVGWYEGAYAVGPRALGDRSILASPCKKGIAGHLNRHVKHREWYRPFGAVVLEDYVPRLFGDAACSPYMLFDFPIMNGQQSSLSQCVSKRGTCRAQILEPAWKPYLAELLKAVQAVSGTGALVNTSLNKRGMPIVDTPANSAKDARSMRLDYLYLDGRLYRLTS